MRRGSDAQRVSRHLGRYDIEVGSSEAWLGLELSTLRFFPNHIEGVIDQVLSGGNVEKKKDKAREQGWWYFAKPVTSLLSKRPGAIRPDAVVVPFTPDLQKIYDLVTTTLLDADMSRQELIMLCVDVPKLAKQGSDLRDAVRVSRDRGARSIHYLAGVLRKGEQRRETKKEEILKARSECSPWTPPSGYIGLSMATIDRLEERWRGLFDVQPDPYGI